MKRIVFVDINSYFATMLQQENPALRGKPVGVVKDLGRTCIIASSNEAKKVGIKTGCLTYEAKKLARDLVLVPTNFDIFLASTRKLKSVFTSLCPNVRVFSLDEAFLDITDCELLYPDALAFGQMVQQHIKSVLGEWVNCNVGISHNHLLAKMAGEIAPKGSVLEITPDNLDNVLATTKFADVCGVGMRLTRRLSVLGVTTPYQINLLDDETLTNHFGPFWARELRKIGKGEETHFFSHQRQIDHMQMVSRSHTGFKLCDNEVEIRQTILNMLEEITQKLRRMNLVGRTVGIYLSGDHGHWGNHKTLKHYLKHTNEIFDLVYNQMYCQWQRTFPIIRYGVFIGGLVPEANVPLCFLPEWRRNERLYKAMDTINDRYGFLTLKPATLLGRKVIHPEVTGFLGDKTYYGL